MTTDTEKQDTNPQRNTISSGAGILHRRYVKDDPIRESRLEAERVNAQVARMIYDQRTQAGLSQKELAELIGTTQSVISRLEDADYEGHSLPMLSRIASALDQKLTVVMTARVGCAKHRKSESNGRKSAQRAGTARKPAAAGGRSSQ